MSGSEMEGSYAGRVTSAHKWTKKRSQRKRTHMEIQNVWKEKWRQSLQANSHHISLSTELSLNPPYMCLGE